MNTELPPSIIVDDHGTLRDAMLVNVSYGMATYKIVGTRPGLEAPPQPTRLEADTARALDLIGKAFGS